MRRGLFDEIFENVDVPDSGYNLISKVGLCSPDWSGWVASEDFFFITVSQFSVISYILYEVLIIKV